MQTLDSCPLCGTKMEKGYVVTEYDRNTKSAITWKTKVGKPRRIESLLDEFRYKYHGVVLNDVEAYRCDNCKTTIILHAEAEK